MESDWLINRFTDKVENNYPKPAHNPYRMEPPTQESLDTVSALMTGLTIIMISFMFSIVAIMSFISVNNNNNNSNEQAIDYSSYVNTANIMEMID